jgi:predicted RNA-binding Zn-ribbon protein involved in translation (DUF1610 family)
MAIKFSCGSCGKAFSARDEHAGRKSKCPVCGNEIEVPALAILSPAVPPPLISPSSGSSVPPWTRQCPYCAEEIKIDAKKCRYCGEFIESDESPLLPVSTGGKVQLKWIGWAVFVVLTAVGLVMIPDISEWNLNLGSIGAALIAILVLVIVLLIYLLPTAVAMSRHHPNTVPIFLVNSLIGWTLVGYVVALAWSFMAIEQRQRSSLD